MTKQKVKNNTLGAEQEEIIKTVDTVNTQLQAMEAFIARRFDEISMEINATSQQFDMAEDGITKRFADILEVLGAINFSGTGNTAANSGVELQAVIEDTEKAANRILDAADRITDTISDGEDWGDEKIREEAREKIKSDLQEIIMACTFQDLTGQRIRNTLDDLHSIETQLSSSIESLGIDVKVDQESMDKKLQEAANQDDIDALMADDNASTNSGTSSQDDIDTLFD